MRRKLNRILKSTAGIMLAVVLLMTAGMTEARADTLSCSGGGFIISDINITGLPDGVTATGASVVSGSNRGVGYVGITLSSEIADLSGIDITCTASYDDGEYYHDSLTIPRDTVTLQHGNSNDIIRFSVVIRNLTKKSSSDSDKKDDDDDGDSSGGMSWEERQREAERHFAPDASKMTPEQRSGWDLVSREAPSVKSSTGGVSVVSAYQGPMCRLAFMMAAPGYSIGNTYQTTLRSTGGTMSVKVPSGLIKAGRKYAIVFVLPDGRSVLSPSLIADANGNLNINLAAMGLGDTTNAAMAIMYQD